MLHAIIQLSEVNHKKVIRRLKCGLVQGSQMTTTKNLFYLCAVLPNVVQPLFTVVFEHLNISEHTSPLFSVIRLNRYENGQIRANQMHILLIP